MIVTEIMLHKDQKQASNFHTKTFCQIVFWPTPKSLSSRLLNKNKILQGYSLRVLTIDSVIEHGHPQVWG